MGFHINIALIGLSLLVVGVVQAEMTARELVQEMDENRLKTTDSSFNLMQLTTCKYGTKDGKLKCVEKPRIKLLESAQINTGANNKDSKSISMMFGAGVGIGMLTYTYDASDKDNETWLYLSALGKVKRIASGSDDEATEPTSMFGSEITTEDQETGKLDDLTLIKFCSVE